MTGSDNTYEGCVEILYGDIWGSVCNSDWDFSDAEVVCKQLGYYYTVAAVTTDKIFDCGLSGPVWLADIHCSGNENALKDCEMCPVGTKDCPHANDAGVICSGEILCYM